MTRDELIVAAWRNIRLFMHTDEVVTKTIEAVEPLIRADERKRVAMDINYRMLARAAVANDHYSLHDRDLWVLAADISRSFALLDGGSE